MYDVVIIGAGPAGSTLARLAAHAGRVLLVDKRTSTHPSPHRVCGGLLAPAAQRALAAQGLGVPGRIARGPQLFAVHAIDLVSGDSGLYQRHYLNVDRASFDHWLRSLVPRCVDVAEGWRFVGLEREGATSIVRFATPGGGKAAVRTRLLVGADGASSAVRAMAFPGHAIPAYTAIQGEFPAWGSEPHFGALFDERLTDHYGWTVPKGDRVLAGLAVPSGSGARGAYERFVACVRELGLIRGPQLTCGSARIVRPSLPTHLQLGADGVILVGEAAGLVSPSSAEGISYALRSGAAAASAVSVAGPGPEATVAYRRVARPLAVEVLAKVVKARVLRQPGVRRAIIRSRFACIEEGGAGLGGVIGELLAP